MKHETAKYVTKYLTDTIFETGAYRVPGKYQNPTVLGQCSHYNRFWQRHPLFGYSGYPQIRCNTQKQVMLPATLGF